MISNFLRNLVKNLSRDVFKPIPSGVLYTVLQSITREISGECPWDAGDECQIGFNQYWHPKCRSQACKYAVNSGYSHPHGLVGYTAVSDLPVFTFLTQDYAGGVTLEVQSTTGISIGDYITIEGRIGRVTSLTATALVLVDIITGSHSKGALVRRVLYTVDDGFHYSSFRYKTAVEPNSYDEYVPIGVLGPEVRFITGVITVPKIYEGPITISKMGLKWTGYPITVVATIIPQAAIVPGKMDLKWAGIPLLIGTTEVVTISKMNLILVGNPVVISTIIPPMNLVFTGNTIQMVETPPPEIMEIPVMNLIWTGEPCVAAYVGPDRLLLHMNGIDEATTFIDEYGHIFTAYDGAQLDTAFKKFGLSSGLFDGVDDYIDTPTSDDFYSSNQDWTFDFRIKRDVIGTEQGICGQCSSVGPDSATTSFTIGFTADNKLECHLNLMGTMSLINSDTAITDSNWHHIALVSDYNISAPGVTFIRLYQDGVQVASDNFYALPLGSNNVYMYGSSNKFAIGRMGEYDANYFSGWIDEVRYTIGIARWVGNFTPPTSEY